MPDSNIDNSRKPVDEIEIRSEEVQEILSRPPHALVRWGITAFFVILVLLFTGGCFFRYPDIVQAEMVITTHYPPVWLVSRTIGRLKEIFITDQQRIKRDRIIAVIENPAVTNDVLQLKEKLEKFVPTDSCIYTITFFEKLALGNIQVAYNTFVKALNTYRDFLLLDLHTQQEQATRKELHEYRVYISHLHKQTGFNEEEMDIAETAYNREKLLYDRNLISEADLEAARQIYLSRKHSAEQLKITLSTARIQEAKLEQNIIEIQIQYTKEANSLFTSLKTAYDELRVSIENWELTYLFISPIDGILSYQHVWQQNQEITVGEKIFSVVTEQAGDIIGKVKLSTSGVGKVKPGQRVNIQLTGYPYMEFGYLTGKVLSISMLAKEDIYTVTVSLPQDLLTSYNRKLEFTGELNGIAEIITEERSFTGRLFEPLRYVWSKYF